MAKKVVRQILLLYLGTSGIFFIIFFSLWYGKLYEELINSKANHLKDHHRSILISILNARFTPLEESAKNIAQSTKFQFAIFDASKIWFDNLDFNSSKVKKEGLGIIENKIFFLAPMSFKGYFLKGSEKIKHDEGLKILLQGEDVSAKLLGIRLKVAICMLLAFVALAFVAYILVKIALRPLEDKIRTLNRFIKDSTHEINTPLSVILMSIEQLERQNFKQDKFLHIKLAAKTLEQIYSDLLFYSFPHMLDGEKKKVAMRDMILERLEYFKLFLEQKKIVLALNLNEESFIFANKNEITRLFDNLLSNAIKYNKKGGKIIISLEKNQLSIRDSGCGISEENLKHIFDRYARFDETCGGFGLGLSLVKKICQDNELKIKCHSEENEGTCFQLTWHYLKEPPFCS